METNVSRARRRAARACLPWLLTLAACGGGGASGPATPTTPAGPTLPAVDVSSVAAADPGSALPAGWQHGAFIEVFVRSYQDSNGDGFGDLQGLVSRLDYLKDLGVRGIWLMPVTASEDEDHGYAVADYRAIEHDYGTLADFDTLIAQAHARGIGVIVDYVMNHSAATNPLFVNSAATLSNAYRDWYVWQLAAPAGWSVYGADPWHAASTGWYYGEFWSQMPDFNLTNPAVVAYHHDNQRFWLNRGVDGFRFDAVGNLVEHGPTQWLDQPENYTLMHGVRSLLDGYSQRYMVCEAPDDPQGFGADTACGGAFAFDLSAHLLGAARGSASDIQAVAAYFNAAPQGMATILSNHDSFAGNRAATQLNGNLAQERLAAASYLLLPGTPFIYYGEEIGMQDAPGDLGDAGLRSPMSWTADTSTAGFSTHAPYRVLAANVATNNVAAQLADPNSLHAFYKAMLALRNTRPSIAQGGYTAAVASGSTLSFQRATTAERTVVVINYGTAAALVPLAALPAGARLASVYPADGSSATATSGGTTSVAVAAQSVRVYDVAP